MLRRNTQIRSIQISCSNKGRPVRRLFQANLPNTKSVRKINSLQKSNQKIVLDFMHVSQYYITQNSVGRVLFCGSFNDTVSSSDYIARNGGLISDKEVQMTRS
jgi:uncharacterized sporulation protein YeaH/YhbH (DUF444 family)